MFTFVVNNDTMKVIGLINPCHEPSQKPAASGPVSTSSFGPRHRPPAGALYQNLALDLIDKRHPKLLGVHLAP